MVRYIILRKHLLLILSIIAFRNKSASAWFLQRKVHILHLKQIPRLASFQPPPTARTEEEERENFSDFENGAANSTIIQNCGTVRVGHGIWKKIKTSPSDTCPFECRLLSQNVNELVGDDKLEQLVETMIQRNVAGFCVQET